MSRVGLYRRVSIHKIQGSQCWDVHVWDRDEKRYIFIAAREVAQDYAEAC
jgi:hypothetical protein